MGPRPVRPVLPVLLRNLNRAVVGLLRLAPQLFDLVVERRRELAQDEALDACLRGDLAGACITFSTLLGELSTTIILYSARWKTMTVAIYEYLIADLLGPASTLGTLLTVVVLASMLLANKLLGRTLGSLFRMV